MLSYVVHLKNKYPGAHVTSSDTAIDCYSRDGAHLVALRKSGDGRWVDQSKQLGCEDEFCLAPIPKNARVHKLYADGTIGKSEEHIERAKIADKLAASGGRVPSIFELAKAGAKIDQGGNAVDFAQEQPAKPIEQVLKEIGS
jgi:hypothetical protein